MPSSPTATAASTGADAGGGAPMLLSAAPVGALEAALLQAGPLVSTSGLVVEATEAKGQKPKPRAPLNAGTIVDVHASDEHQVRVNWYGKLLLGQQIIGETIGFLTVPESAAAAEGQDGCEVKCFCEIKRWGGQMDTKGRSVPEGEALTRHYWGAEQPAREPDQIEQRLKDAVRSQALPVLLQRIRSFLLGEELTPVGSDIDPEIEAQMVKFKIQARGTRYNEVFLPLLEGPMAETGQELDLGYCNLEDDDLVKLATALKGGGSSVQKLDLSNNKFGDAGLHAVVIMLGGGGLPKLEVLDLKNNPSITTVGQNMLKGLGFLRKGLDVRLSYL